LFRGFSRISPLGTIAQFARNKLIVEFVLVCLEGLRLGTIAPSCAPLLCSHLSPMTDDPLTPQTTWSQYTAEVLLMGKRPIIGSYDHRVVEERAREAMKDNHCAFAHSKLRVTSINEKSSLAAYMFTFGNAGTGSTYRRNREALEQWRIIPRMLRNATHHRNLDVITAALLYPASNLNRALTAPPRPPSSASSCLHPYS